MLLCLTFPILFLSLVVTCLMPYTENNFKIVKLQRNEYIQPQPDIIKGLILSSSLMLTHDLISTHFLCLHFILLLANTFQTLFFIIHSNLRCLNIGEPTKFTCCFKTLSSKSQNVEFIMMHYEWDRCHTMYISDKLFSFPVVKHTRRKLQFPRKMTSTDISGILILDFLLSQIVKNY